MSNTLTCSASRVGCELTTVTAAILRCNVLTGNLLVCAIRGDWRKRGGLEEIVFGRRALATRYQSRDFNPAAVVLIEVRPNNRDRFLMNKSDRSFVQHVVLAARKLASKSVMVGPPIQTVAELQQQIHDDLRRQHPEWIEPTGESPMCDFYEARLSQLLEACARSGSL